MKAPFSQAQSFSTESINELSLRREEKSEGPIFCSIPFLPGYIFSKIQHQLEQVQWPVTFLLWYSSRNFRIFPSLLRLAIFSPPSFSSIQPLLFHSRFFQINPSPTWILRMPFFADSSSTIEKVPKHPLAKTLSKVFFAIKKFVFLGFASKTEK